MERVRFSGNLPVSDLYDDNTSQSQQLKMTIYIVMGHRVTLGKLE